MTVKVELLAFVPKVGSSGSLTHLAAGAFKQGSLDAHVSVSCLGHRQWLCPWPGCGCRVMGLPTSEGHLSPGPPEGLPVGAGKVSVNLGGRGGQLMSPSGKFNRDQCSKGF